ncbi:hypothetical protein ACFOW1_13260 [Parasediminibacterium paludis]|uniref:Gliding motility-associated protein GldM first immunoglobulin-like domain-containing protein n=1 Tax=Parasediminibacterium paludis TaxID=908966 RepID=A0ABV8PZ82_9BACT
MKHDNASNSTLSCLYVTMQIVLRFTKLVLFVLVSASCGKSNKSEQLQLETLAASLEKSNALIEANCSSEMHAFKNRLSDPYENTEAAKDYLSKAEAVNKLTDSIISYLNAAKAKFKNTEQTHITNDDWSTLYKTLKAYRTNILQLDTNANKEFERHLEIINPYFDSTKNDSQNFNDYFFKNTSTNLTIATITVFQNNILIAQSDINGYFNKKCLWNYCGFDQILPVVSQDKSYVKAGENIEITAGIGIFSTRFQPIIKINGIKVSLNVEGFSVYNLKAASTIGTHTIPLEVSFIDFNSGKRNILQKQMKYTVINVDSTINKE